VEGSFITPKIVGESVGVHPLGVMLALIIGGELFGLFGLIAGIPAAASIRVFYHHLMVLLDGKELADASQANNGEQVPMSAVGEDLPAT
jgi:predicted PurR-regulated permease PerM